MIRLANDIVRCHDAACPEREQCQRWVDRDWPPAGVRLVHAASLRAGLSRAFVLGGNVCGSRIPAAIVQRQE